MKLTSRARAKYLEVLSGPAFAGLVRVERERRSPGAFAALLAEHRAVLSPPDHGYDCFRTWEALALGAIPVLRVVPNASEMDAAKFAGLPIVWVHRWKEVTRPLLTRRWQELRSDAQKSSYSASRAFFPHWLAELLSPLSDRT